MIKKAEVIDQDHIQGKNQLQDLVHAHQGSEINHEEIIKNEDHQ